RRRHTMSTRDWSSDVCSSDLNRSVSVRGPEVGNVVLPPDEPVIVTDSSVPAGTVKQTDHARKGMDITVYRVITENGVEKPPEPRSEERRVGEGCETRWREGES